MDLDDLKYDIIWKEMKANCRLSTDKTLRYSHILPLLLQEITVSERYWSKILWADKRTTSNSALVEGSSSCKWKKNLLSWSFSSHSFLASKRNEWNCSYITLWDVNEPTHYSKRVEDEVPGDVVYLRHLHHHSSWVERAQWAHKRTDSGSLSMQTSGPTAK